jgi:hypothetical protein
MIGWYVDPAVHKHALAVGANKRLTHVGFIPTVGRLNFAPPDKLVIEKMRIYKKKSEDDERKDPNDLLDIECAAGRLEGAVIQMGGPPAKRLWASTWKGQISKPVHHQRLWLVLSPEERAAFAAGAGHTIAYIEEKLDRATELKARTGKVKEYSWAAHNLFDALGIMLFEEGRTGKAGARR